jgi:hypothetical protein
MGNVGCNVGAELAKGVANQASGGNAVGVEIAVDGNRLCFIDGADDALSGSAHIVHGQWIMVGRYTTEVVADGVRIGVAT